MVIRDIYSSMSRKHSTLTLTKRKLDTLGFHNSEFFGSSRQVKVKVLPGIKQLLLDNLRVATDCLRFFITQTMASAYNPIYTDVPEKDVFALHFLQTLSNLRTQNSFSSPDNKTSDRVKKIKKAAYILIPISSSKVKRNRTLEFVSTEMEAADLGTKTATLRAAYLKEGKRSVINTVNNLSNMVAWFTAGYVFKFGWEASALYKSKRKSDKLWEEYRRELERYHEERV
ncbi:unnamed protein product [Brassica oleracea]|uniref:(rape) hypothetical protein n=1 Tax=Brassica napus TaxID=3708 RepID=A0A816JS46_BRANA|nr:unnamed protein product [Brassica napus]